MISMIFGSGVRMGEGMGWENDKVPSTTKCRDMSLYGRAWVDPLFNTRGCPWGGWSRLPYKRIYEVYIKSIIISTQDCVYKYFEFLGKVERKGGGWWLVGYTNMDQLQAEALECLVLFCCINGWLGFWLLISIVSNGFVVIFLL